MLNKAKIVSDPTQCFKSACALDKLNSEQKAAMGVLLSYFFAAKKKTFLFRGFKINKELKCMFIILKNSLFIILIL